MEDLIASLGLVDADAAPFNHRVVTGRVVAENQDAALVEFTARNGKKATGVLPVTEFYRSRRWAVGEERYTLLQCDDTARPLLSATRPELVTALLAGVSPEVRTGAVRVMAVARRAGQRTKIAVASTEAGVDAVAACVGRKHNRTDHLKAALFGEQIDIVAWHQDPETYLRNALQPAAVIDVVIDEAKHTATASAPAHQMSAAVGGGGLNSALAGQLVGLGVRIIPA